MSRIPTVPDEPSSYLEKQDHCHRTNAYEYLEEPFGYYRLGGIAAILKAWGYRDVLDIGCGIGVLLELVSPQSYVGVDVSECAIQKCKRRFSSRKEGTFVVGNPLSDNWSFPDGRFDVVIWAGASFGFLGKRSESGWRFAGERIETLCREYGSDLII